MGWKGPAVGRNTFHYIRFSEPHPTRPSKCYAQYISHTYVKNMFQKPNTSERSFSHAKYQFSDVLTASSPDKSLVMCFWVCSQVFPFLFFLLDCPGWSRSCGVYDIFSHVQSFRRAARQVGRGKLEQILSVL